MSDRCERRRVVVTGYVQGIFYRDSTRQVARSLGLNGWVRNQVDGSVEAVFEGEVEAVERAVEWCGRGPSGARIDEVVVVTEPAEGIEGFEIKH